MHAVHICVRSIATCVAWPVCVSVCILVLVTTVFSSTETDEPVEVPFGVWAKKPCIRWGALASPAEYD